MLGRTKDQIRTTKQVHAALNTCQTLDLDGLLIIGGTILVWLIWANIFFFKGWNPICSYSVFSFMKV